MLVEVGCCSVGSLSIVAEAEEAQNCYFAKRSEALTVDEAAAVRMKSAATSGPEEPEAVVVEAYSGAVAAGSGSGSSVGYCNLTIKELEGLAVVEAGALLVAGLPARNRLD